MVTFIQRFGSALNLNIHLHMLVPDGAWRFVNGKAHIHRVRARAYADIERLLARLIGRITRWLVRAGVLVIEGEQPYLDVGTGADDALTGVAATAVRYRTAVGPLAGQRTMRLRVPTLGELLSSNSGALTANHHSFSLNAAVACGTRERDQLERLCRHMARGPLSNERLSIDGDGLVVHELKRPFRDGTTQCLFEPLDFLARLTALVPRPQVHLIRYHVHPMHAIARCCWPSRARLAHPMSPKLAPHAPRRVGCSGCGVDTISNSVFAHTAVAY